MNLPFFVARRYLFAKKKRNVINLINWVTLGGIAIGTTAILLVLSTFNGLSEYITGMYAIMDPELKVVAKTGRLIPQDSTVLQLIAEHPGVEVATQTIESKILIKYQEKQRFAILKGVEPDFVKINPIDRHMTEGQYTFEEEEGYPRAIFALGFPFYMGINLYDKASPVEFIFLPNKTSGLLGSSLTSIRSASILPSGFFSVQTKEYDENYILTDFEFAQTFFSYGDMITAYELKLKNPDEAEDVKDQLTQILPENLEVLTMYDQHRSLYRVMRNEKFISYLILTLMVAIAAINIVGSLSMIVLEKTRDIAVLKSMGATPRIIRQVFLWEGTLIGGIGVCIGVILALGLGLAQQAFSLIYLEGSDLPFPISMNGMDFVLICTTVFSLCALASIYPSYHAGKLTIMEGIKR